MADADRKIVDEAADGSSILYSNDSVPEIFVEGIGRMFMGPAVTKFELFRITDVISNAKSPVGVTEHRDAVQRVVIPTATLVEFCAKTILLSADAIPQMRNGVDRLSAALKTTIEQTKNVKL